MRAQSARDVVLILWIKSKKDLRSSNLITYQTEAQANFLFFFSTTICELYLLCNQKGFSMSYLNTMHHIFLNITCVIANFSMKLHNRKVDIVIYSEYFSSKLLFCMKENNNNRHSKRMSFVFGKKRLDSLSSTTGGSKWREKEILTQKIILKHRSYYFQDVWHLAIYHFKFSQTKEV